MKQRDTYLGDRMSGINSQLWSYEIVIISIQDCTVVRNQQFHQFEIFMAGLLAHLKGTVTGVNTGRDADNLAVSITVRILSTWHFAKKSEAVEHLDHVTTEWKRYLWCGITAPKPVLDDFLRTVKVCLAGLQEYNQRI